MYVYVLLSPSLSAGMPSQNLMTFRNKLIVFASLNCLILYLTNYSHIFYFSFQDQFLFSLNWHIEMGHVMPQILRKAQQNMGHLEFRMSNFKSLLNISHVVFFFMDNFIRSELILFIKKPTRLIILKMTCSKSVWNQKVRPVYFLY